MHKTNFSVFTIAAGMMMAIAANAAMASQIGVVGLYEVGEQEAAMVDEQKIHNLDCRLRREGFIGNEDGDIDIDEPNRFVVLACDDSILTTPAKRRLLNKIVLKGKLLAVLEGELSDMPAPQDASIITERQYILKISHFNNRDTDGRERDLDQLRDVVKNLPDTYVRELSIDVSRAMGMQTPDEVVMLFYNSPEQGARFRDNNDEILNKISGFNKKHLNDYIYYVGKAVR